MSVINWMYVRSKAEKNENTFCFTVYMNLIVMYLIKTLFYFYVVVF